MAKKSAVKKLPAKKPAPKKATSKKSAAKKSPAKAPKIENVEDVKSEVTNTVNVQLKNVQILHEKETKGKLVEMYMTGQLDEGNTINVTISEGTYQGIASVRTDKKETQDFTFIEFSVQLFVG